MELVNGIGATFKGAHTKVAEEVLRFRRYGRHEWTSDRTRNLVEKKRTVRLNHDKDLNRQGKKSARTGPNPKLYKVKLIWQLARLKMPLHIFEISELLAHGKSRLFSMIMATLYDKAAKAHRWKNHFEQLLNHPSVPCPDLPSTVQEVQQACQEPSELLYEN